jgi:plastocyanin
MKIIKNVSVLTLPISLFLITNLAIAGGTITGKVICKRLVTPKNSIVYVERVDGRFEPPIEHAFIDQKYLLFIPHVLPVLVGTTVDFKHSDIGRHNVFSPPPSAKVFDLGIYSAGTVRSVVFDSIGEVTLLCSVHPEMHAYIVILQNPYFAITDNTGTFTIAGVPSGKYRLNAWHEKFQTVSEEIEVTAGDTIKVNFVLEKKR